MITKPSDFKRLPMPTSQMMPKHKAMPKMICPSGYKMLDGSCRQNTMPAGPAKMPMPEYEKYFPRKKKAPTKSFFA